jgi:hypothetical protein
MNVRARIFRCAGNQKVAVSPGFPVELVGVGQVHAAFVNESRTRGPVQRSVQEIRVAHLPRILPARCTFFAEHRAVASRTT